MYSVVEVLIKPLLSFHLVW